MLTQAAPLYIHWRTMPAASPNPPQRRKKVRKEEVVNVRMTATQKKLLTAVATRRGLGLSSWMLSVSLEAAEAANAAGK